MVLALTVALVEQARRPWVVDGQVVGTIGPRVRLMTPEAATDAELAGMEAAFSRPVEVPEVVIPLEDRKRPAE
jgi:hypothetical protein